MFTGLPKHTPPTASPAAAASDQGSIAQTTVPTIPRGHLVVGSKDQLRILTPVGSTSTANHCAAVGLHAARSHASLNEEDEGGGGGRVKKKRKKKDKRQWEKVEAEEEEKESSKPKRQKEEKETTVLTLRRSKEPKERKERRTKGKGSRKDSGADPRNAAGGKTSEPPAASGPVPVPVKIPGKRGRKPKVKVLPPVPANQGL